MIPRGNDYLSYLMGASAVSEDRLRELGVTVLEHTRWGLGLLVPAAVLGAYREVVRAGLDPGYWNEVAGRDEILFTFKLKDGTLKELAYPMDDLEEISRLCSELNGDPLERTSDIPRYLAGNRFYRDLMLESHGVVDPS